MPVRLDAYYPNIAQTSETTKSYIIAYIYSNPEYGYQPSEIRDLLDLPYGAATTILKHLYEQEYVEKTDDGYYHAAEDREDLHCYVADLDHLNRIFDHPTDGSSASSAEVEGVTPEPIEDAEIEDELAELESKIED
ncbi:helix-turn-helix domain-containing protein [Halostella pelagica]|uniref:helix-turn-helix domain-containing protein n=1 Tax=Halostella pelagica TaxID=2583824 RepID=UPI001F20B879|nr:helix-turn-helix domain-containing protein [Halostella pelagica]